MSHDPQPVFSSVLSRREWLALLGGSMAGAWLSASGQTPTPGGSSLAGRICAAYQYLQQEMDLGTAGTIVFDDANSGFAAFYPAFMGDAVPSAGQDSSPYWDFDEFASEPLKMGTTCLKITYRPGPLRWAGVYWLYPNSNWGQEPGRSIAGATHLKLWARGAKGGEVVKFGIGGVNRAPYHRKGVPYQDSFGPGEVVKTLTTQWQEITLPLPRNARLNKVIGGLSCVLPARRSAGKTTIFLDQVAYNDARPNHIRFLRSYAPAPHPAPCWTSQFPAHQEIAAACATRHTAYLYDNALALLAFLARGEAGKPRARLLAEAFIQAQAKDRAFSDGLWRNAYTCGPLQDSATQTARLPGWYDPKLEEFVEDEYASGIDAGNMAWAMLALLAAHRFLAPGAKDSDYLRAAQRAGEWVEKNCRVTAKPGGYRGGFECPENPGGAYRIGWRSAEHNLDLYAVFTQLAALTNEPKWAERAQHARRFVLQMWAGSYFYTGTHEPSNGDPDGTRLNRTAVPLDVQTWSLLALGHDPQWRRVVAWDGPPNLPACLAWVEEQCRVKASAECANRAGYKFSNTGKGLWFEGAAQVAAAYRYAGRTEQAEAVLDEIIQAQPDARTGGITAACGGLANTGFKWQYLPQTHVGATAWFLLAAQGLNPYWLGVPKPFTPEDLSAGKG